jgi:hypothetical protein
MSLRASHGVACRRQPGDMMCRIQSAAMSPRAPSNGPRFRAQSRTLRHERATNGPPMSHEATWRRHLVSLDVGPVVAQEATPRVARSDIESRFVRHAMSHGSSRIAARATGRRITKRHAPFARRHRSAPMGHRDVRWGDTARAEPCSSRGRRGREHDGAPDSHAKGGFYHDGRFATLTDVVTHSKDDAEPRPHRRSAVRPGAVSLSLDPRIPEVSDGRGGQPPQRPGFAQQRDPLLVSPRDRGSLGPVS